MSPTGATTAGSNGKGSSFSLPMDSWYGSRRRNRLYALRQFALPRSWQVEVFGAEGIEHARTLSDAEIRQGLMEPTGTEPLRRLAEERRDAVIVVDDMSRPTPAYAVLPHILDDLGAAGIGDDRIRIVIGMGTHRPITRAEQRRKLGREIVERVEVVNHNAFTRKLTTYSRPGGGPDFAINRVVGEADLKIAVNGVVRHPGAGFSGGAKAVLPSVASYDSIRYNHGTFEWEGYCAIHPEGAASRGIRRDMELVARIVELDFSVNLVSTPYKDVVGVFAGDVVQAHRAACVCSQQLYTTAVPAEKLDLAIIGAHPFDTDMGQSFRASWAQACGQKSILVSSSRDGWAYHADGGKSYREYRRLKREQQQTEVYQYKAEDGVATEELLYHSPIVAAEVFYERPNPYRFCERWDEALARVGGTERERTVGVFPYATIQIAADGG